MALRLEAIETREVLADAYVRRHTAMLSHAVYVNWDGIALNPLCNRVKVDNIADRNTGIDLRSEPTCKACRRSWRVYRKERPDLFVPLGQRSAIAAQPGQE